MQLKYSYIFEEISDEKKVSYKKIVTGMLKYQAIVGINDITLIE
jgi:hypothetical protein